jgi:carbonic anhydrase
MSRLIAVSTAESIFPEYRNSPTGLLLEYDNLNRPLDKYAKPQLLIGMCIDNRKRLRRILGVGPLVAAFKLIQIAWL